jgi:hypothetical protein
MGSKKGSIEQSSTLTGEQGDALSELLKNASPQIQGILGNLGFDLEGQEGYQQALALAQEQAGAFDPSGIQQSFQQNVADPAIKQFNESILPGIQERAIAGGAGRSSAARNQASQAGVDLQKGLSGQLSQQLLQGQAQKEQLRQGTINQLLGLAQAPQASQQQDLQGLLASLGLGLGTQAFQNYAQPGKAGLAQGILGAGGALIGGSLGGPTGAAVGGNVGSQIGGAF